MKIKFITSAIASLAVSLAVSGSAQAAMIAGWDFSQYIGSGELSVDGASYTNVLSANYSNLLLAPGAGPSSAAFGTLFFDGQFGSANVDPSSGTAQLTPASGSLSSNVNAPATAPGLLGFGSLNELAFAGQPYQVDLSLQVQAPVSFVFAAYLDTVPGLGSDWSISFGGQTLTGSSVVVIDYSTNGTSFTNAGQRTLNTLDTLFTVSLAGLPTDAAYVRLTVDTAGSQGSRIDNVALNATVPEPGAAVLLGAALAVFSVVGRRRKA